MQFVPSFIHSLKNLYSAPSRKLLRSEDVLKMSKTIQVQTATVADVVGILFIDEQVSVHDKMPSSRPRKLKIIRQQQHAGLAYYKVNFRKLLSAHKSPDMDTSLFTGAVSNQVRNSQTSRFVSVPWLQVKIRDGI